MVENYWTWKSAEQKRNDAIRDMLQLTTPKTICSKVIFLDVDGVLNRCDKYGNILTMRGPHMKDNEIVDLNIVGALGYVLAQVPWIKVVASSTWREYARDAEHFARMIHLHSHHMHEDWRTISLNGDRRLEVDEWLNRHPEIVKFNVIDDSYERLFKDMPFVHTKEEVGMTFKDLNKLMKPFGWCVKKDLQVSGLGGPTETE